MAWTFSNWITETDDATRLTILRQHVKEVSDKIQANVGFGGNTRDSDPLLPYLTSLRDDLKDLERRCGSISTTDHRRSAFTRARLVDT